MNIPIKEEQLLQVYSYLIVEILNHILIYYMDILIFFFCFFCSVMKLEEETHNR